MVYGVEYVYTCIVKWMNTLQLALMAKRRQEIKVLDRPSLRDRGGQEILLSALLLLHQTVGWQQRQRRSRLSVCRLRRNRFDEGHSERRPRGRLSRQHLEGCGVGVSERGLQAATRHQGFCRHWLHIKIFETISILSVFYSQSIVNIWKLDVEHCI